jgi:hypothetical protein
VSDERVDVYGLALERALRAEARAERAEQALKAAEGVLYALPKAAQSKRRSEVLAQVRRALADSNWCERP